MKLCPWFLLPQFYQWPVPPCFDKFFKYHTAVEEISYPVKSANFDEDCYTDYKYALQPRVKQLQCDVKQLHILYNLPAFLSDVPWCPWEAFNITKRQCWQEKTAKGQIWPALNIFWLAAAFCKRHIPPLCSCSVGGGGRWLPFRRKLTRSFFY